VTEPLLPGAAQPDVGVIPTATMTAQFREVFDRHANAAGVRISGR
jgi:hypothetical protein